MKNMTLEKIAEACGGKYIGIEEKKTLYVKGVVIDSRLIEDDYLFVPIKGEKVDGHDYIKSVLENGAAASLSEKKIEDCDKPYILVKSTHQALKDIAMYYRDQINIPVVGITGSVGKTSTKEMIASVLEQKYNVLKTQGNFNNEIGLPLTLLRIRDTHQAAVVEMGISDFGEMHRLSKMAKPDVCVITNIGMCHLENLIDRDGVLRAKSEIFDFIKEDGFIILNGDDDKLNTIHNIKNHIPMFYGIDGAESTSERLILARNIENLGLKGTKVSFQTPKGEMAVHIPIPGRHNVYNAMAAVGVGLSLGLSSEQIKKGIEEAKTIVGRTNIFEVHGVMVIDDCYNANPVSMKASIDVLENGLARKIAVLGDMGELGEQEKQLHYSVGEYAAQKQIDTIFCAGELSTEIAKGAIDENDWCEVFHFDTKEDMLPNLLDYIQEGDTVLVKASHFMEFQEIVEAIRHLKG